MFRKAPRIRTIALLFVLLYVPLQFVVFQSLGSGADLAAFNIDFLSPASPYPAYGRETPEMETLIDLDREIRKGLEYARSIQDTKRKLLFVHIPKTAGTTIEEVGGLGARVAWGSCLFNHRPKRRGNVCRYPPGQFEWPTRIGYWHLPTQLFPLKGVNPYEGADLFAVFRDPYDRLLSEFYYICRRKLTKHWNPVDCNRTRLQEPKYMNEWVQQKLQQMDKGHLTPKGLLNYNGHFTPQADFLVSYPAEIRMVEYVLQMDNLSSEFTALMKAYDIAAEMLPHKKNAARNDTNDLEARHFDSETLALVHERYVHDLEISKYRKLS